MCSHWQDTTYTMGEVCSIGDLVKDCGYRIESWGNSAEGWAPYLVKDGSGLQIGPMFSRELGDTLRDLKEAAARIYGIAPGDVKRGRNFP